MDQKAVKLHRHDMVFLSPEGLAAARGTAAHLDGRPAGAEAETLLHEKIPAVVARQSTRHTDGMVEVGFPLPQRQNGGRLRLSATVPAAGITRVVTPFDAALFDAKILGTRAAAVLAALRAGGQAHGLQVGVYGSLAMHLLTGLPYFSKTSDYDIFVQPATGANVAAFYRDVCLLQAAHGVKIDTEIACLADSGAKLAELFSGQKTVLCKGLYEVQLCPIEELGLI